MIDEFPVWNSEPDQPTMMSWAAVPEREEVSELQLEIWCIDDRSSPFHREMEGAGAVWVVSIKKVQTFYHKWKSVFLFIFILGFRFANEFLELENLLS